MYHAGLTAQGCWDELDDYDREAIVKFGKLIVQDCIQVIHQQERIPKGFLYAKGVHTHKLAIKEHFGIE
jgi:TRAP-type C4-dicarboxylate transport system substrate-binding protein